MYLIVMSTTGLAGAATAITAALALLGPGGMIGGIITLVVVGAGSSIIAKYCKLLLFSNINREILF